jgi:opacity protein-like surface antigen
LKRRFGGTGVDEDSGMRIHQLKLSLLAGLALMSAGPSRAADYAPPMPPQQIIVPQPVEEFAEGWYLRGDIGMSTQSVGSISNANYAGYESVTNVNKGFDSAPTFGVGIGYTFNSWFRADVTAEYRGKANFHGFDVGYQPNLVALGFPSAYADDRYTGSKSELTFLLNGYVDLGTWNCITPFVGAGVGFSRNTISDFGDISTAFSSDVYGSTASKWSFAWALYAGLAYQVTKNVTVELAYRYIDLGSATSGPLLSYDNNSNPAYEFNHITSQDVRLGVRFNLNAPEPRYEHRQVYVPAPVYTQPQVYSQPPVYAPPVINSRG